MKTLMAVLAVLATLAASRPAAAVNARVEAAAKTAIERAGQEVAGGKVDAAMTRLQNALAACGVDKCSKGTKAALLRDVAAIEMKRGNREAGANALVQAFGVDPTIEPNPKYDVPELKAEWEPAKDEAAVTKGTQPSGDFSHTPAAEQTVNTPLPVFAEYSGGNKVARVTLKYKGTGMHEYKRIVLAKKGGGYAATIPCGDVKRGGMRYYIEGYDGGGDIVATSGSPTQPFGVPIRTKISASAPSLPGTSPPRPCTDGGGSGGGDAAGDHGGAVGASCNDKSECKSDRCVDGSCAAAEEKRAAPGEYSKFWIGIAGSVDFISLPAATDVCARSSQASNAGTALNGVYYCVNPDGSDYPGGPAENLTLVKGASGNAGSGFAAADIRVMLTVDYAATANFLIGGRLGYVFNRYPGSDSITLGHGLRKPVHFEVRATYLIGDAPLAVAGFAPFVFLGAGITEFDAQTAVSVTPTGSTGPLPKQAWLTAGPWFIGGGGGVRYAFTPRAAASLGLRIAGTPGPSGFMAVFAPELQVAYGF